MYPESQDFYSPKPAEAAGFIMRLLEGHATVTLDKNYNSPGMVVIKASYVYPGGQPGSMIYKIGSGAAVAPVQNHLSLACVNLEEFEAMKARCAEVLKCQNSVEAEDDKRSYILYEGGDGLGIHPHLSCRKVPFIQ